MYTQAEVESNIARVTQYTANGRAALSDSLLTVDIEDSEQRHESANALTDKYVSRDHAVSSNLRVALGILAQDDRKFAQSLQKGCSADLQVSCRSHIHLLPSDL